MLVRFSKSVFYLKTNTTSQCALLRNLATTKKKFNLTDLCPLITK